MELRGGWGGGEEASLALSPVKLSLVPSPSLIVRKEACSALHADKKKEGPGIHCLRICWIS